MTAERSCPRPTRKAGQRRLPSAMENRCLSFFGSGIVAAYSTAGKRLWIRHVQSPSGEGDGTSPVWADGKLIVNLKELAALDPATGKEVWRTSGIRPKYGTPAVARVGSDEVLVTANGMIVRASDGKILAKGLFQLSVNSPIVADGVIYAHEVRKTKAFRLPSFAGEPFKVEPLWEVSAGSAKQTSSAIVHDGLLYAVNVTGVLSVLDAGSGKKLFQKRVDLGRVNSSIALAGNSIFISSSGKGKTLVLRPGKQYDQLHVNPTENTSSCLFFAGQNVFVRAGKSLYCIGADK